MAWSRSNLHFTAVNVSILCEATDAWHWLRSLSRDRVHFFVVRALGARRDQHIRRQN